MDGGVVGLGGPAPFGRPDTLTLALSHGGRGDAAAPRLGGRGLFAVIFVHPLRAALRLHASPSRSEGEESSLHMIHIINGFLGFVDAKARERASALSGLCRPDDRIWSLDSTWSCPREVYL